MFEAISGGLDPSIYSLGLEQSLLDKNKRDKRSIKFGRLTDVSEEPSQDDIDSQDRNSSIKLTADHPSVKRLIR